VSLLHQSQDAGRRTIVDLVHAMTTRNSTSRRRRNLAPWLSILLSLSFLVPLSVVQGVAITPAGAASPGLGAPFDCSAASIYGLDENRLIYGVQTSDIGPGATAPATVASTSQGAGPFAQLNGLAITAGGASAYVVDNATGDIWRYDAVAETWTSVGVSPTGVTVGAINPLNGDYYFGTGYPVSAGTSEALASYDPTTGVVTPAAVTAIFYYDPGNGDIAFDGSGDLYIVNNGILQVLTAAQVALGGMQVTTPISILTIAEATQIGGIAFNADGQLYLERPVNAGSASSPSITGTQMFEVNPDNGDQIGVTTTVPPSFNDLASCSYNPTLALQKNLPSRYAPTDQFALSINGPGVTTDNQATTSGTSSGLQAAVAGPLPVLDLSTYTLSETAVSGSLLNYVTTYSCVDTTGGDSPIATTPISSASFSVNLPLSADPTGQAAVCTFTNTPLPRLQLQKALAGPRSSTNDQFTTQITSGSPTGPVVNSTANSTTTGTGSTVTPGTGTTGVFTGVSGTPYYLSEMPVDGADLDNYASTITCVDANGLQPKLPNGAPFTGSYAISPVNGSNISCTLTNTTAHPAITVVKSASPTTFSTINATVDYSYTVTNTGNVTLSAVAINDAHAGLIGLGCPLASLDPTKQEVCTATYQTTQGDLDAGSVVNTASAQGFAPGATTPTVSSPSTATVTAIQSPAISVLKTSTAQDIQSIGQRVPYVFTVTNTGNVDLSDVSVADKQSDPSRGTSLSPIVCPTSSLSPASAESCTATYIVTAADLDHRSVSDSAVARGTATNGTAVVSPPSILSIPLSSISIVKSSATTGVTEVGQSVPYSFVVTNSGATDLTEVRVKDFSGTAAQGTQLVSPQCPSGSLKPGEIETCTSSYLVTSTDLSSSVVADTAVAVGLPPSGHTTTSDPSTVSIPVSSGHPITLLKTADTTVVTKVGQKIHYSFLVTNGSNTIMSGITVIDTQSTPALNASLSAISCPSATLAVGASETCTATYTTTATDLANGYVKDTAVVTATPLSGSGGQPLPPVTSPTSSVAVPVKLVTPPTATESPIVQTAVSVTG
jgi:uncharacterized repeat protein (TIGR01451 family)